MTYKASHRSHCLTTVKDRIIALKEKGKKITFRNPACNTVIKVQVDNCAITTGKKCDWLIVDCRGVEFYVELKGTDISTAIKQLTESIKALSADPHKCQKHSFVVCSEVAPAITTK